LYAAHRGRMVLATIYIQEAHAADEWPVGQTISFCNQPQKLDARCSLAKRYVREFSLQAPMLVDTMANKFHEEYAAWPFRFYAIRDGRLALKAQPIEPSYKYDVEDLNRWLEASC